MFYDHTWKGVFNPGKAKDYFHTERLLTFETKSSDFSGVNAWWLSELSRLIYMRGDGRVNALGQIQLRSHYLAKVGMREQWFYNGKHVQCSLVSPQEDQAASFSILVFRGIIRGASSWTYVLDLPLSPWPSGGCVHKGFKRILLEVWEAIADQLKHLNSPLYFTGHSLGGALAVLSSTLVAPVATYTFGAPRFVDAAFVRAARHRKIYRMANQRDIVAHLPPLSSYYHVGEPRVSPGAHLSKTKRVWNHAPAFLTDHSAVNYSLPGTHPNN